MVETHGLNHISLHVADLERALAFYREVFGVSEYFRDEKTVQVKGPGPHDILVFEQHDRDVGVHAGVSHFGFRLKDPVDIDAAVEEAERAGGKLIRRGEFSPGFPYAFVSDPDGYVIEIWYE
jgi:glyoxylase I family protein